MWQEHPNKMDWFASQEDNGKGNWRSEFSYEDVKNGNSKQKYHLMILMIVIVAIVDCNMEITIKQIEDYAKYYYSVKTLLKQKPLTFEEWQKDSQ